MDSKQNSTQDRLKMFRADEREVLDLLGGYTPDAIVLGKLRGIPEGAIVRGVHHSYECRGFDFIVEHESFPEVHRGCQIPWDGDRLSSWRAVYRLGPDGKYSLASD